MLLFNLVVPVSVFYLGFLVYSYQAWFAARCSVYVMTCLDSILTHYLYGLVYFMLAGWLPMLVRSLRCNEPDEEGDEEGLGEMGYLLFEIFWVGLLWCALAPVLRDGCREQPQLRPLSLD